MYKYDRDGQTIEEFYGLPEEAEMTPEVIRDLLLKFVPQQWHYPDLEVILDWLVNKGTVPLFAGTPPLAEAHAAQRGVLELLGRGHPPFASELPASPYAFVYDGSLLSGGVIDTRREQSTATPLSFTA